MSDDSMERPKLRSSIDVAPVEQDGRQMLVLYDAAGLAAGNLGLTQGAFAIVTLMNGQNTLNDILAIFAQQFRQELPSERLVELLHQLDRNGMLEGPRFEARFEQLAESYRKADVRPSQAMSADVKPDQLRDNLRAIIDEGQPSTDGQRVVGLIAPHLDYERGRPCYAEAYAQLRDRDDVDRFVILGTNHFGRSETAVWTIKDYDTPLGRAETDREFIDRLRERCGADLGVQELDHAREHSVELQVILLKALLGSRPVKIVPVLCPDACGPGGLRPASGTGPGLDDVAAALADVVTETPGHTCVIAAADLSHVGRRFGDDRDLDDAFLQDVQAEDRALLDLLEAGDADELVSRLRDRENPYRVCSAGGLYVLLRAVRGCTVRVLRYHQAVNREEHTGVTCAAAVMTPGNAAQEG